MVIQSALHKRNYNNHTNNHNNKNKEFKIFYNYLKTNFKLIETVKNIQLYTIIIHNIYIYICVCVCIYAEILKIAWFGGKCDSYPNIFTSKISN